MNRETKLALILGLAVFLIVGVFMGEHYSSIRQPVPNADVGIGGFGDDLAGAPSLSPNNPLLPERVLDVPRPVNVAVTGVQPAGGTTHSATAGQNSDRLGGTNQKVPGGPAMIENGKRNIAFAPNLLTTNPEIRQLPGGSENNARTWENPLQVQNPLAPPGTSGPIVSGVIGLPISAGKELAYTVKAGDSGAKIAKSQYNDAELWARLREYNKTKVGKNDALSIGTTLRIPPKDVLLGKADLSQAGRGVNPPIGGIAALPFSNDATGAGATGAGAAGAKAASEKPTDLNAPKLYTVKTGDTLMTIAKSELGTSNRWKEILDLNKRTLAAPENLQLGMQLRIPAKDSAKERAFTGTVR